MTQVKRAAVAGMFYPGEAETLQDSVDTLMRSASAGAMPRQRPHALVAPHAGYRYSGPIAASAYATLVPWKDEIRRVALLAPSHRVPLHDIALSSAETFATPLGQVPVDTTAVVSLSGLRGVVVLDAAFAEEHALEVQLPFLQRVLDRFTLVPLIVGEAASEDVVRVIEQLRDDTTLIIVSSDLSHYHPYADCRARDRATSRRIEALKADDIGPYDACGAFPLRGLLRTAERHGWHAQTLDLRSSGDTSGDKSRVVGYGAYAFY